MDSRELGKCQWWQVVLSNLAPPLMEVDRVESRLMVHDPAIHYPQILSVGVGVGSVGSVGSVPSVYQIAARELPIAPMVCNRSEISDWFDMW